MLETLLAVTLRGSAAVTGAGAGQLAQSLSRVLCEALVSGLGLSLPSSAPRPPCRGWALGHDRGPDLKPCFFADEFQRLCVQGLPLLPSYPGPFPGLPGFGSNGVGPGLGQGRHSPHASSGRGVPSLGLGNVHIGEAWDLGRGIQDLREWVPASEGRSALWGLRVLAWAVEAKVLTAVWGGPRFGIWVSKSGSGPCVRV